LKTQFAGNGNKTASAWRSRVSLLAAPGNGGVILRGILAILLGSVVGASAVVPAAGPILTIGLVTETNSAITLSPLEWASKPVWVDLRTRTVFVRSGEYQLAASVVCSNQPVLAVQILSQPGHTNEIEWSSDLVTWTRSNVRWISDGTPIRYYVPVPVGERHYRVRHSNTPPTAELTMSPVAQLSGMTDPVAISFNNTDAVVLLDGSQSTDAENDPLQFAWTVGTNIVATTTKTTSRLPLGRHAIKLEVNDGLATDADSVSLETIRAVTAVELLISQVRLLGDESGSHVRSLLASLEAAARSFDRGHLPAGVNQLHAFQNQVWAQLVSFNQGNTNLIQEAEEIIRAVGIHDRASGPSAAPHAGLR
jgi:hypothetical protein